jgi:hypothetical protein
MAPFSSFTHPGFFVRNSFRYTEARSSASQYSRNFTLFAASSAAL